MSECAECTALLHEALNLTVRGRKLDMVNNRQAAIDASVDGKAWVESGRFDAYVESHNETCNPGRWIEKRSLTPQLWAEDQFQKDLLDWEQRARRHMIEAHP